jgi:nucleoside-diphosphate-sugar epimerase
MRIFVTGASGFVGSAVVRELLSAGHQVLGLARSERSAQAIREAGAEVHPGDLEDIESLQAGARACDAIIHTGFIHDFTRFAEMCETDRRAVEAMGEALLGTEKPFVITSGVGLLRKSGELVVETDMPSGPNPRIATEQAADAVAAKGVRVSLVRLPPSTHGVGDHGFVPMLIDMAQEKGVSVYAGAGENRWPAVHRLDAAKLYRLAIETPAAPGTRYHAVADQGVPFREIAEVIGRRLRIPVESKTPEEAAAHFAWFAHFAAMDVRASAAQTRAALGWEPTQPGLIDDIDQDAYFERPASQG